MILSGGIETGHWHEDILRGSHPFAKTPTTFKGYQKKIYRKYLVRS